MGDTTLGGIENKTYTLRQIGGRDEEVIEKGETVQVLVTDTSGQVKKLTPRQAKGELARLGIDAAALGVGRSVPPLVTYIHVLQQTEKAAKNGDWLGTFQGLKNVFAAADRAGIQPDRSRIDALCVRIDKTLMTVSDDPKVAHTDESRTAFHQLHGVLNRFRYSTPNERNELLSILYAESYLGGKATDEEWNSLRVTLAKTD